jgi:peptide chain release factor subunit 1
VNVWIDDLDPAALRRLSGLRPERGKVLSLYLNLDPSDFATPAARTSAITSLLDEAARRARENGFEHDEAVALREDVQRAKEFFEGEGFAKGAASVAVFACGPAGLFEALKLPRPVGSEVVIDDTPWVEPLASLGTRERVCVALVSRRSGRVFRGSREALEEVAQVDDDVHRRHDQGGWSQSRYQRGIEKEVEDHLEHVAGRVFADWKRSPFDRLVVGCTAELYPAFEHHLHPYVRESLAGRVDLEYEYAGPADVVRAVRPLLEDRDREREHAALERLQAGLGAGGRAAAGLEPVLAALNERRVEILLYADGERAAGVACPRCGWLGVRADGDVCPLDGTPVDRRENVVEDAIEATVLQSAQPLVVRDRREDLAPHGGIAAVLRF